MPKAVFSLKRSYTIAHLYKQILIKGTRLILFGQDIKQLHQSAKYPTVSTSPEYLCTVGLFHRKITMVTVEQSIGLVKKIIVSCLIFLIHKTKILLIACQHIQLGVYRWSHEKRIAPCPMLKCARFSVVKLKRAG